MELPNNMDSKFRFILVIAKRARQLQAGAKSLVQIQARKFTKVAQAEVELGLVPFEILDPPGESGDKAKKQKGGK